MSDYNGLMYVRHEEVAGVGPWLWIATDHGAWIGPKEDWEQSHVHAIEKHVKKRGICIQAGGNQGMYPRLLSDMFERVYTFEPDPLNFYCLTYNCQKDNIFKMQAALGAYTGLARVNRLSMGNTGCHTVDTDGDVYVPMLTVDALKLPGCDYIQFDLESYELTALTGAIETIEKYRPVIQCENGNDAILQLLTPYGYKAVDVSRADTIYVAG